VFSYLLELITDFSLQSPSNALLEEIESANSMLINTIASIAYDNVKDGITSSSGGTLIMLSYTAVSVAPRDGNRSDSGQVEQLSVRQQRVCG
jgi:hypothetical protein